MVVLTCTRAFGLIAQACHVQKSPYNNNRKPCKTHFNACYFSMAMQTPLCGRWYFSKKQPAIPRLLVKGAERCDRTWAPAMFARLGAWWARDLRPPSQEKEVAVVTYVLHIFCIMPHGFCCELQWRIWPIDPVHHRLSCGLSLFIMGYPCPFPCSSTSAAGSR